MAQLLFYDKDHVYELDGIKIPSVSEVIRFISRETYGDINQFVLDNAAERGKSVHKACEQIIKFGKSEVEEHLIGYVNSFISFIKDNQAEFMLCEKAIACTDYAGTIDLYGIVNGKKTIVDLKTVSAVHKTLVKAQLNGYKHLMEVNGFKVERLICLQLIKDGKYRKYDIAIDSTEFDSCLALHKALSKKHLRGEIN